jgi:hypothetical protein
MQLKSILSPLRHVVQIPPVSTPSKWIKSCREAGSAQRKELVYLIAPSTALSHSSLHHILHGWGANTLCCSQIA